jgi:hypothetical protein
MLTSCKIIAIVWRENPSLVRDEYHRPPIYFEIRPIFESASISALLNSAGFSSIKK